MEKIKTIEEIQKDIACEYGEIHFEVLLSSEIEVGDFTLAKKLLYMVADRYVNQFMT